MGYDVTANVRTHKTYDNFDFLLDGKLKVELKTPEPQNRKLNVNKVLDHVEKAFNVQGANKVIVDLRYKKDSEYNVDPDSYNVKDIFDIYYYSAGRLNRYGVELVIEVWTNEGIISGSIINDTYGEMI